jgi:monooxygenase
VTEQVDTLIVGAGLSGIGAAYRLQTGCPTKSYAIVEGRQAMGGTWDLFRYPGVRSDSDMFTLGYQFRPWGKAQAIADGPSIRRYIEETASEFGIDRRIRYGQKVVSASWDSSTGRWTVETAGGESYDCGFLYMCSGYYRYERGYEPSFPGHDRFAGQIIHPQHWPEGLDYDGKKVVIIGSGATAVTLVPAMAKTAGHVTMLQRSPSYVVSVPGEDPLARLSNRYLPKRLAHQVNRLRNVLIGQFFYQFCRRRPKAARRMITKMMSTQLPDGYAVDPNFKPSYNPWDQRMCLVPDADLFKSISDGRASVVTDQIRTFTEKGIQLESGQELEADIIVTATGLQLVAAGGVEISVDGRVVDPGEVFVYRGCMLSGLPNFAMCVGYTNASWTLRADLSHQYVCRLLNYMDDHGFDVAVPTPPADLKAEPLLPLNSGYVQRAAAIMPKQGDRPPWRIRQNYLLDFFTAKFSDVSDGMTFSHTSQSPQPVELAASA